MNITKSNDHRRMFDFDDNDIPLNIFEQECEDYQDTSSIGGLNPAPSFSFPWKMHEILDDAEKDEGFQSIISWLPDHKDAFRVHNPADFIDLVMPKYFKQTKYKSFQRQINIWGFCRISSGPDKGGYVHPYFVRDKPSLCCQMVRRKIKGGFSTFKRTSSVATRSLSKPNKTCFSSPCLMQKEFGDAPFFSNAPVACYSSVQPAASNGVGVLLEEAGSLLDEQRTDFVKNYSAVAKSSSRHQAISPRSQNRRHSLKQWIDSNGVGVLIEAGSPLVEQRTTDFVKNHSAAAKSFSRLAISPRSQSRNHSLKQWLDIHDDDEQELLQVLPSNFDLESIFS